MSGGRARRSRGGDGATALERHAAFFDRDGDGLVAPGETLASLRDLGVGAALAVLLTGLIHLALGPITQRRAALRIRVDAIARGKRGVSSGVFGEGGRFAPAAFARLRPGAGDAALTLPELRRLIATNPASPSRNVVEGFFSWAETRVLFCLAADATRDAGRGPAPAITLRRLRSFYDGGLFYALARRRRLADRARDARR